MGRQTTVTPRRQRGKETNNSDSSETKRGETNNIDSSEAKREETNNSDSSETKRGGDKQQ